MSEKDLLLATMGARTETNKGDFSGEQFEGAQKEQAAKPAGSGGVTSWNDLTDKPFGTVEKEGYILPETDLLDIADVELFLLNPLAGSPILGETYIVIYDGVEYNCVAQEIEEDYLRFIGLGSTDGTAAEYPFTIALMPDGFTVDALTVYGFIQPIVEPTTSTMVSVYGKGEFTETIDEKYLPTSIPQIVFIDIALTSDGMGLQLTNGSFYTVHAAFMNGNSVFARMSIDGVNGMFTCVSVGEESCLFITHTIKSGYRTEFIEITSNDAVNYYVTEYYSLTKVM